MKPHAGLRHLDSPADVELVTAERHHAHRDAGAERLDRYPMTTVADDARGALQDGAVWHERLDASVRWGIECARVERTRRHDDREGLVGKRLECSCNELV